MGGTLQGTGNILVSGVFNWNAGTIQGTGTLTLGSSTLHTIATSGTFFTGQADKQLGKQLINQGTITWTTTTAVAVISSSASFTNDTATSQLLLQADTGFSLATGINTAGPLTNRGTIRKSTTTGITNLTLDLNNAGLVDLQTGTLQLLGTGTGTSSGQFTVSAGATLTANSNNTFTSASSMAGAGTLNFNSGTNNVQGAVPLTGNFTVNGGTVNLTGPAVAAITLTSGTLNGNGTTTIGTLAISNGTFNANAATTITGALTLANAGIISGTGDCFVSGIFTWTAGTVTGTGTLTLGTSTAHTISGSGAKSLGRQIINQGTLTSTTTSTVSIVASNGGITNDTTTSLLLLQNDTAFSGSTIGTFTNRGTIRKTATATGTTVIGAVLNNAGLVDLSIGTLQFASIQQTSGELRLNGGSLNGGTGIVLQGGLLDGTGTITGNLTNGGEVRPGSPIGTLTLNGNYTQTSTGTLTVDVQGRTAGTSFDQLKVNGTVTLDGNLSVTLTTPIQPADSFSVIDNDGTEAVTGGFKRLLNNTAIGNYVVSYTGGTGNDVVLAYPTTLPTLQINDVRQIEGTGGITQMVFTVTQSFLHLNSVAVNYATVDGTATAGQDYNAVTGTLTFAPGELTKTISVPIIGDFLVENKETFSVVLSSPLNATVAKATGIGTIIDDDSLVRSNLGNDFWLTFPGKESSGNENQLSLSLTGPDDASATVGVPALGFTQTFTVKANQVTTINVPLGAEVGNVTSVILANGIHITSDTNVAVYAVNHIGQDEVVNSFLGLPTNVLDKEYVVPSWANFASGGLATDLTVLSTTDNTHVTITPSLAVDSHAAGVPFVITLNRGQTYQLQKSGTVNDLSGSIVQADQPVGVFVAHQLANSAASDQNDYVAEQIMPTSTWGKSFITVPLVGRQTVGDTFTITAQLDGTLIRIDGQIVATLNRGQIWQGTRLTASTIEATQPIFVARYVNGTDLSGYAEDPLLILVPPVEQFQSEYTVTTSAAVASAAQNFITVVVPTADLSAFLLDELPVAANAFTPVSGTSYSVAHLQVANGAHHLLGASPFGVYLHGFIADPDDTYGYSAGFALSRIASGYTLSVTPASETDVIGTQHSVTATLVDRNGQPVVGERINFAVAGVNPGGFAGMTNAQGQVTYTYTSNKVGVDTIQVNWDVLSQTVTKNWILPKPAIQIQSPNAGDSFTAGSTVLISGRVTPGAVVAPITGVLVNGVAVDAVDAGGEFFARVTLQPGQNTYQFVATDSFGQTATATVTLNGLTSANGKASLSTLSDVSTIRGEYGVTSWNNATRTLYAEVAIHNTGTYNIQTPLLVGVKNLSNAAVTLGNIDGITTDGIQYYDFSKLVGGATLAPGQVSGRGVLTFHDPEDVPFTYDLVLLGQLDRPPVFTSVPVTSVVAGAGYRYQFQASDADSNPLTYAVLAGPSGLAIPPGTAELDWTPTTNDIGNHTVIVEVSDGNGGKTRQQWTLTVTPPAPNRPPVLTTIPSTVANVGSDYTYSVAAVDADGQALTFSLATPITGMSVVNDSPNSAKLTWRPTANQVGLQAVDLIVDDGNGGTTHQLFNINVQPAIGDTAPVILSQPPLTAISGKPYTYEVRAIDAENDPLTYTLDSTSVARGMTIDAAVGVLRWTPTAQLTGDFPVTITVADGRGAATTQSFTVSVRNLTPAALTGTVFQDSNGDGLRQAGETPLAGWTVFLDQNGNHRLDVGEVSTVSDSVGNYSFTNVLPGPYNIALIQQDGWVESGPPGNAYLGTAAPGSTITGLDFGNVSRAAVNHVPLFVSTPPSSASVGFQLRYDPIVTDADGDLLTFSLVQAPDGMAIDPTTGTITWTPTNDNLTPSLLGRTVAVIDVDDGLGGTALQSLQLTVTNDNTPPVINSQPTGPASINTAWTYPVQATDANGDALTFTLDAASLARGMTINPTTGLVSWTPTKAGQYRSQVTVSDGRGGQVSQTFDLSVGGNSAPIFHDTSIPGATVGQPFSYTLNMSDPNGSPVTLSIDSASLALGVTLTGNTLHWTPTAVGTATIVVTADDGQGGIATETITLPARAQVVNSLPPSITSQPNASGPAYVGTPWTYVVAAADADNPAAQLTYSLTNPTNITGATFDPATHTLTFTSTTTAPQTFTIRVTDNTGSFSEQTFTITPQSARVGQLPQITSIPLTTATVGTEYNYQATAIDGNGDPLTFSLTTPVAGASINAGTGRLTFTPTTEGSTTFSIRVDDGIDGFVTQTFTVVAALPANHPPRITSVPAGPAIAGQAWTYQGTASDPDGDAVTFSLSYVGSEAVTIDGQGRVSWTPSSAGTSITATLTATDSRGATATQTFTLNAEAAPVAQPNNTPPVFTSTPRGPMTVGQTWNYVAQIHDAENNSITFTLDSVALAQGFQIDPTSGTVKFTPSQLGTYTATITADDGHGGQNTQTFTIDALVGNVPPTITSTPTGPAYIGQAWNYTITASDLNDSPATLVYSLVTPDLGAGVAFDAATHRLSWTPTTASQQTFVVRVTDPAGAHVDQTFSVTASTVTPPNQPPQILGVPVTSGRTGELYTYDLRAFDPNGDVLTYTLLSSPPGMTLDNTGHLSWTPTTTGTFNIAVAVSDGINSPVTQTFAIAVAAPVAKNQPPSITSTPTGPAARNTLYTYQATASDPEGEALTWSLDASAIPAAARGDLALSTDGKLTWTPSVAGTYSITLTVADPHGATATQQFSLSVDSNAPPRITSTPVTSGSLGQSYSYQVTASDPNPGDTLTYAIDSASLARGLTINAATGAITWTTPAAGVNQVTVTVTDPSGATAQQTYDLRIINPAVNNPPVIRSNPSGDIQVSRLFAHQLDVFDADGDPLTFTLLSSPTGMTLDSAGLITWTPAANQLGTVSFSVQVSDGHTNGIVSKTLSLRVVSTVANQPPTFTSQPNANLVVGTPFVYTAAATDPNGDTLTYTLVNPPTGMTINATTGLIQWTPKTTDVGTTTLTVRVVDANGIAVDQTTTLTIRATNSPPVVSSTPPTQAVVNQPFSYAVRATDVDQQTLTYSLGASTTAGGNIAIDSKTGVLTWTPTTAGTFRIQINVVDSTGLGVAQVFNVTVSTTAINHPPVITSTPPLQAEAGKAYTYTVAASDPDGNPLSFSLLTPATLPANVTFNSTTGLLTFTPTAAQANTAVTFEVAASDGSLVAKQRFTVQVAAVNVPPTIAAIPAQTVTANANFRYDIQASDANSDPLTYSLDAASLALGLTLDNFGRLTWSPKTSQISSTPYAAVISVSDGRATTTQTVQFTVVADHTPPTVDVAVDKTAARLGDNITIKLSATDNVAVASRTLILDSVLFNGTTTTLNQALAIDSQGRATLTLARAQLGTLKFHALATDAAGNQGDAFATVSVTDPADTQPPSVSILSPTTGTKATDPLTITATITDNAPGLSWTVKAVPADGGAARLLASGTGNVTSTAIAQLDNTLLRDGAWTIQIDATDAGGNVTTRTTAVEIDGQQKLGRNTISFQDLTVPVAGFPITITRTYDSLNADLQGDFGYGWKLDLSNTKVQIVLPGQSPTDATSFANVPFQDGTRVVITLPDGTKQGFTFYGKPIISGFINTGEVTPQFVADTGVSSQLLVDPVPLLSNGNGTYTDPSTGDLYSPTDPAFSGEFTLQLRNGTQLVIDAKTGDLLSVSDRNNNTLNFTGQGIESTLGRSVQFTRDSAGRITSIADNAGRTINYDYDGRGNLVAVTDRVGATTRYTYLDTANTQTNPATTHYLNSIIDPLGKPAARSEYDNAGRLIHQIDAAGRSITYAWNQTDTSGFPGSTPATGGSGRTIETITDQLGNVSILETDPRGNVTRQVDPLGKTTLRTFDNLDHLLSETTVVGQIDSPANGEHNDLTTRYTYNAAGDLLSTTDPRGNTTRTTYNTYGQPTSVTDPLGNVTTNNYDPHTGLLTSTRDPLGNTTSFTYDDRGNVLSVRDTTGNTLVTNTYNQFGDVTSTTPATGAGRTTFFAYDINGNRLASWSFDGTGTTQTQLLNLTRYDANNHVVSTTQAKLAAGHFLTTGFDTAVLDPAAVISTTSTEYNADGQVAATVDTTGLRSETTYDSRGQAIQTRTQSRDSAGNLVWLIARTAYDAAGHAIASTEPLPEGSSTPARGNLSTYDAAGRVTQSQSVVGLTIDLVGTNNSLTAVITNSGRILTTTSTRYDAQGRVTETTDNAGLRTQITYNPFGDVTETRQEATDETGQHAWLISRTLYDTYGRTTFTTDTYRQGTTAPIFGTLSQYDAQGRAFRTERHLGVTVTLNNDGSTTLANPGAFVSATETRYDTRGRTAATLASFVDSTGTTITNRTDFEYDILNRQTAVISPATTVNGQLVRRRTETVYDTLGRAYQQLDNIQVNADGSLDRTHQTTTTSTYDTFGRVIQTDLAARDATNTAKTITTKTEYDTLGRTTATIDPLGNRTEFTYDAVGNRVSTKLPPINGTAPTYTYGYDARGNQTSLTDPNGHTTTWIFDDYGHQTSRTLPNGFTESFAYNDLGQETKHTDFAGHITETLYDAQQRPVKQRIFDNQVQFNNDQPTTVVTSTYDAYGHLSMRFQLSSDGSTRVESWAYNDQGLLATCTTPEGTISYTYNTLGQKTATITGTKETDYAYDNLGRLAKVTEKLSGQIVGQPATYTYDLRGNIATITGENGVKAAYTYDDFSRITELKSTAANGSAVLDFLYTWNNANQKLSSHETVGNQTADYLWSYDADNRLTNETITSSTNPALNRTEADTFDGAGNRITSTVNGVTTTYHYDVNDELLNTITGNTEIDYTYTGTNQTGETDQTNNLVTSRTSFEWNDLNRLITQTKTTFAADGTTPNNIVRTKYTYDTDNLRTSVETDTDPTASGTFTTRLRTDLLADKDNPTGYSKNLRETTTDLITGQVVKTITYSLGTSFLSQTTTDNTGTTIASFTFDGHGSTRAMTDLAGATIRYLGIDQLYFYTAYGEALGANASNAITTYLYSGQQTDASGKQYLLERYYDPTAGRFTSFDPAFGNQDTPLAFNKFVYANANPVFFSDPTGLFSTVFGTQRFGYDVEAVVQDIYRIDHPGHTVTYGAWSRLGPTLGPTYRLKPDILNFTDKVWAEVKPLSPSGVIAAAAQYVTYAIGFAPFGFNPDISWAPSKREFVVSGVPIIIFNAGGIIFYTDVTDLLEDSVAITTIAAARLAVNTGLYGYGQALIGRTIQSFVNTLVGIYSSGTALQAETGVETATLNAQLGVP